MTEQNSNHMSRYQLKKLIKKLEDIRGRNTELVSLYIPAGYDMSKISDFVTSEASEAENIKSKHTRKNVQAALDKIGRKVQEEHETPENGVAFFAGNVSEREGRPDIQIWEVVPPQPIESRHYRCDKEFVLEPLREMVVSDKVYGLIALDKNEAAIGYLQGSSIKTEYTMSSEVPGKTRAGGQCLDPDTVVQKSNGELACIEDIEVGDTVKAVDFESMRLKDSVVQDKWEETKEVYRIETKHPKMTIKASGDHKVFTCDQGVREAYIEDLNEKDTLIFPEKIDSSTEEKTILAAERYYNSYRISDVGRTKIREKRGSLNLSQSDLAVKADCTQAAISKLELGERDLKRNQLENICSALDIDTRNFVIDYCAGKKYSLPRRIDSKLAQILGYFAGDGSFDPERLNFHEQDKEVAEKYRELLEKKFNCNTSMRFREDKNYYNLRAFGKPIVEFIKNEFPEIKKSRNTTFPEKILRAREEILFGFIRGFYDAEGHASMSRGRIGISANNKIFMKQLQSSLLRAGIISSLTTYDNSKNPYSDNTRYTVSISDIKSVLLFKEKIGFSCERKNKEVKGIIKEGKKKIRTRQVITEGRSVRNTLEEHGYKMEDFKSANTYLQNKGQISKEAFRNNFITGENPELEKELQTNIDSELLPAKIKNIEKIEGEQKTIDISVEAGNFIANGLVVHNSAQRFARIRKEMLKNFLSDVAENAKKSLLNKAREDKLLGLIVGGPGFAKDKFMEDHLHQELKEKVVATEDLNYSGEEALEELVNKAEDAIKDAEVVKEKNLVNKFFQNLKEENGKSEYGPKQVEEALEMGAVETVLITEDVNLFVAKYTGPNDEEKEVIEQKPKIEDSVKTESGQEMELETISDIVDEFGKKAEQMNSNIEIISIDHEEGRRLSNMGGVAAIMRYRIR